MLNQDQKRELNRNRVRVADYVKKHPEAGRYTIAGALDISLGKVQSALFFLRSPAAAAGLPPSDTVERKESPKKMTLDCPRSVNVRTLEDLIRVAKVDLTKWKVERFIENKYEVATKNEATGDVTVTELWQVKATFIPLSNQGELEALRGVIADLRTAAPAFRYPAVVPPKLKTDDPHLLEISIPDLHLGKLAWGLESGENYDTKIAEKRFHDAVVALWERASVFPVHTVLLPLGNDFFNVNNAAAETAAGTSQVEDGRWQKSFRKGWELMRWGIEYLRERSPGGIDVIMCPGNHDPERLYYAGEVLHALYENSKDVRVNNLPNPRKYFRWGVNLLGFTHGHGEKPDKLPLIMAGECPQDWAQTTHREFHLGHLHHKRETQYHVGNEHNAVRVRILPSLCAADAWHHLSGYVGARKAAEAYLWGKKSGYTGHLSWSPQ